MRASPRCVVFILCVWAASAQTHIVTKGGYWQQIDQNRDGVVDETEYLEWMMYGFRQRDRNGDHVLSGDERPPGSVGPITETQQRQALLKQFHAQDQDGNNKLSPHEFFAPPR